MNWTKEQKRKAVIAGAVAGIVLILFGNQMLSIVGLIIGFAAIAMQYVWFRCPKCGIFIQLWHYKDGEECPQCGQKL